VGVVLEREGFVVGHHVTIVQPDSLVGLPSPANGLLHSSSVVPPPQLDVVVHPVRGQSFVLKTLWVVTAAVTLNHAGAFWIVLSARTMHHVAADDVVELWFLDGVGDFGTDQGVKVGCGDGLIVGMKDDEEMSVGQTSFLRVEG